MRARLLPLRVCGYCGKVIVQDFRDHAAEGTTIPLGRKLDGHFKFRINPERNQFKPRILSTAIDPADNSASIDLAFAAAEYFGLNKDQATAIAAEVAAAVSHWREEAKKIGITKSEIDRMASAFEHDDLTKALGK